jgi:iron complex outermembrane receptor protein
MDNANLGYNFGKIDKIGTLRATFSVQNVFVITKYTGLDPEVQGGIDNQLYPRPRIYSIGLNLGL